MFDTQSYAYQPDLEYTLTDTSMRTVNNGAEYLFLSDICDVCAPVTFSFGLRKRVKDTSGTD